MIYRSPTEQSRAKAGHEPGENPGFFCWTGGLLAVIVAVTLVANGCDSSKAPGASFSGKVVFDGKGVFPGSIILKDDDDNTLTANLNAQGEFVVRGVENKLYTAVVQTQKLAGVGRRKPKPENDAGDGKESSTRTEVPDKFKNANVDIPDKYSNFDSSGLEFDFRESIPEESQEIVLQ
jgi:hypothetical protein